MSLGLSGFELVTVSPRLVEPLNALSIVWVGVETLRGVRRHQRLPVVFGFGLLHGLGFGGALWGAPLRSWASAGPSVLAAIWFFQRALA